LAARLQQQWRALTARSGTDHHRLRVRRRGHAIQLLDTLVFEDRRAQAGRHDLVVVGDPLRLDAPLLGGRLRDFQDVAHLQHLLLGGELLIDRVPNFPYPSEERR